MAGLSIGHNIAALPASAQTVSKHQQRLISGFSGITGRPFKFLRPSLLKNSYHQGLSTGAIFSVTSYLSAPRRNVCTFASKQEESIAQTKSGSKASQQSPSEKAKRLWGRLLYTYYNWRQGTGSDLQLIVGAFFALIFGNAVIRQVLDGLPPGDTNSFWGAMYEVIVLSFGEAFPDSDDTMISQMFSVGVAFLGLAGFALVLALVEQAVLEMIDTNVRQGSQVYEEGHILVLGWCTSRRDLEVIWKCLEQLCFAYRHKGGATVVVLTSKEKLEMESLFRKAIPDAARYGTRFVFRKGSPLVVQDLEMVAAQYAKSAIIVSDLSRRPDEADAQAVRAAIMLGELRDDVSRAAQEQQATSAAAPLTSTSASTPKSAASRPHGPESSHHGAKKAVPASSKPQHTAPAGGIVFSGDSKINQQQMAHAYAATSMQPNAHNVAPSPSQVQKSSQPNPGTAGVHGYGMSWPTTSAMQTASATAVATQQEAAAAPAKAGSSKDARNHIVPYNPPSRASQAGDHANNGSSSTGRNEASNGGGSGQHDGKASGTVHDHGPQPSQLPSILPTSTGTDDLPEPLRFLQPVLNASRQLIDTTPLLRILASQSDPHGQADQANIDNSNPFSKRMHVVVELKTSNAMQVLKYACPSNFQPVRTALMNSRRIAKMVGEPITAVVSQQIMDCKHSTNMTVEYLPQLIGTRFGQLKYLFDDATVLGICKYKRDGSPPDVNLLPDSDYKVEEHDWVVMYRPTDITGAYSPLPEAVNVQVDTVWKRLHQQDIDDDLQRLREETEGKPEPGPAHNYTQQLEQLFAVDPHAVPSNGTHNAAGHSSHTAHANGAAHHSNSLYQPDAHSSSYDYNSGSDVEESMDDMTPLIQHSTHSTAPSTTVAGHPVHGTNGTGSHVAGLSTASSLIRNAHTAPAAARTSLPQTEPCGCKLVPEAWRHGGVHSHEAPAAHPTTPTTTSTDPKEKYKSMIPPQYMDTKSETPTRVLVFGWGQQSFMRALIRELDAALKPGSQVTFANLHDKLDTLEAATKESSVKHITTEHYKFDPLKGNDYQKLGLGGYDAAIVLVDEKWVDPDEDDSNGVDPMARQDVLRLDSMAMMVQLNIRKAACEYSKHKAINIISQKVAMEGLTRFEDRKRLPLGICVNMTSYAAKLLVHASLSPLFTDTFDAYGANADFQVIDAKKLADPQEEVSWWQLIARAEARHVILVGWYQVPKDLDTLLTVEINPQGHEERSKAKVWNRGDGMTKFVALTRIKGKSRPTSSTSSAEDVDTHSHDQADTAHSDDRAASNKWVQAGWVYDRNGKPNAVSSDEEPALRE